MDSTRTAASKPFTTVLDSVQLPVAVERHQWRKAGGDCTLPTAGDSNGLFDFAAALPFYDAQIASFGLLGYNARQIYPPAATASSIGRAARPLHGKGPTAMDNIVDDPFLTKTAVLATHHACFFLSLKN